ncbi:MAG: anaerobic ribonucleoside-triphosphate reductase activating protein [Oscillospiraceae bacterium]|nr:anaerobic ribonucleoside-triphosphate reductase activating protein [Oscillospiraceae bacterium]
MLISGLQKLTLLDYPGHVACTVFTAGCNFRCPFCHNAPLVLPERIEGDPDGEQTVLQFLRKRQGILDGVAITGGEPLLQRDLPDFLRKIRALGYQIKLDTNGSFPDRLIALVEEGLVDRVAMDVKNSPALYAKTAGLRDPDLAAVERSKDFLLEGHVDYEFRTTVVKGLHTAESLKEAAAWIRGAKEYYLQQFKDSGDIIAIEGLGAFSGAEMRALAEQIRPIVPAVKLRGVDEAEKT